MAKHKHPQDKTKYPKKLNLQRIKPITSRQELAFNQWYDKKHLVLHGMPGTGKTFCALYLAFEELLYGDCGVEQIVIFRSAVASRDIGFLPGRLDEKMAVYEVPYINIVDELFKESGRNDMWELLQQRKQLRFESTSYVRGLSLDNTIVIIDELQNCDSMELHSLVTRLGHNSRLILSGDIGQNDLKKEKTGAHDFFKVAQSMKSFAFIEFGIDDIVRSKFVKEYIIAREELRISGEIK